MHLLDARNIAKSYGSGSILRDVSLRLEAGRMLAVMGPSGCGKSTLLHILGLLQAPDSGSYTALGQDLLRLGHSQLAQFRRRFFGFVLQSCAMFAYSTVEENVEYPLIYAGIPREERRARVDEVLAAVGMRGMEKAYGSRLSGGEQQRVAIARALVNRPRVLLADEPTGQLDARNTERLMDHFRSIREQFAPGIIVVTHDPRVAVHCDEVFELHDGLIVKEEAV